MFFLENTIFLLGVPCLFPIMKQIHKYIYVYVYLKMPALLGPFTLFTKVGLHGAFVSPYSYRCQLIFGVGVTVTSTIASYY